MSRASHFQTRRGALTALERVARRSVYASGGACTTVSVPMLPRAPGGFSMMCRISRPLRPWPCRPLGGSL
jgi:hypothetical protein